LTTQPLFRKKYRTPEDSTALQNYRVMLPQRIHGQWGARAVGCKGRKIPETHWKTYSPLSLALQERVIPVGNMSPISKSHLGLQNILQNQCVCSIKPVEVITNDSHSSSKKTTHKIK
jgi:hypothetical protein